MTTKSKGGEVIDLAAARTADAAQADETPTDEVDLSDLRAALDDLRVEIRARFPVLEDEEDAAELDDEDEEEELIARAEAAAYDALPREDDAEDGIDWMALFDELRTRLNNFGMREQSHDVDAFGMEAGQIASLEPLLEFLSERYWRIGVSGLEHLPEDGPALFVANRSGILPYDGLMLAQRLAQARPNWPRARFLVADGIATLPFVQPRLNRLGGVRACPENALRLLQQGSSVLAFPEGEKGATKVFRDRYRVQRFGRGGVVRAAIEGGVPLVPVGIVGPEETHPVLWKSRQPARLFGLPFLPVTPTFPLLGPLGLLPLPTKWRIHFGEPILANELRGASDDDVFVWGINEELRDRISVLIDDGLDARESVWD